MTTIEDWKGRVGAEWADKADALDTLLGPSGEAAMRALGPLEGRRVLDLGCGAGATAFALARAAGPRGEVVGVDVSPPLLERARRRLAERPMPDAAPLRFVLADAARWRPDDGAPFDALYSRCGAMFFDDPPAAWAHLRSLTAPGAPLAIACWRGPELNLWASLPLRACADLLAPAPPPAPGAPGPFAWADPARVVPVLEGAGWREVAFTPFDHEVAPELGDDPDPAARAADFAMRIGPLASRLAGAPADLRAEAARRLRAAMAAHLREGAVRLPASAWIVTARA
ncbi:class I SAM-dependent methyltransferase [Oceanicella actignis]|uniref:Methyltransferase domain-containing protein n=1 Tax=Oceanicella actignis TaxID=1189325 RepID=A0A1M7SPH3_9RHOB|nr:class I SAM-dependent methyltransferase [Oceanicella actignis]SES65671.1 Methyltransferase domain-containing protein [Oceanicella actignis]SHN60316.1 Methyltransferase domain-containing protein [Oceanicella actignis]